MGGWKEVTGLALVLEVTCHQSLQHFFTGWLSGTEEKAEGRGDSKDTFSVWHPGAGNETEKGRAGGGKQWLGMAEPARQTCTEDGMQPIVRESNRGL